MKVLLMQMIWLKRLPNTAINLKRKGTSWFKLHRFLPGILRTGMDTFIRKVLFLLQKELINRIALLSCHFHSDIALPFLPGNAAFENCSCQRHIVGEAAYCPGRYPYS